MRGALRAIIASVVSTTAVVWVGLASASGNPSSTTTTTAPQPINVLRVSFPDSLSGCSPLDGSVSDSLQAIYDLTFPSAFVSNRFGKAVGATGPITQSEVIAVSPFTVRYNVNSQFHWTNGVAFSGAQMVRWWKYARTQTGPQEFAYRSIQSLLISPDGSQVTAVFGSPNSGWTSLFRDIQLDLRPTCNLPEMVGRPQLGAYRLVSLQRDRVLLEANSQFAAVNGSAPLAQRISISAGVQGIPLSGDIAVVTHHLSDVQLQQVSSWYRVSAYSTSSAQIERVGFSAVRPQEQSANIRSALVSAIDRLKLVWSSYGANNPFVAPASSSIYPASWPGYQGTTRPPLGATTTTTSAPATFQPSAGQLEDCAKCVVPFLRAAGFTPTPGDWSGPTGFLVVRLAVGPSIEDHLAASAVARNWRQFHIEVVPQYAASELDVLASLRDGQSDAGVYHLSQPTPAETATRWALGADAGPWWTGWNPDALTSYLQTGLGTLNSVNANSSWTAIDTTIQQNVWDRPLYTIPLIEYWTSRLPLSAASSDVGFLDQVMELTPAALQP